VKHEQKRKIEIGYVNIDNTGNIQNSSSKEEKHSSPTSGTNKLPSSPYTGKQSIKILTSELTSHGESTHRSHIDEANTCYREMGKSYKCASLATV
jgi:hypothetical protein